MLHNYKTFQKLLLTAQIHYFTTYRCFLKINIFDISYINITALHIINTYIFILSLFTSSYIAIENKIILNG